MVILIRAWAPGHATLFFGVPSRFENPSEMGSIGGGFNFSEGVTTEVKVSETNQIYWNTHGITGEVTLTCIKLLRKLKKFKENFLIIHQSKLPIGYGLSTSGAGAIGALLAINTLLELQVPKIDLFELAHQAEIYHHTGLGSVVGQITSGIELRLSQGGPQKCNVRSYESDEAIFILLFAPLQTSSIITSDEIMKQVTNAGINATKYAESVEGDKAINFIKLGQQFTENCGLITDKVKKMQIELQSIGEEVNTMAMIGETIIVIPQNKKNLSKWLKSNKINYLETSITNQRPKIVK